MVVNSLPAVDVTVRSHTPNMTLPIRVCQEFFLKKLRNVFKLMLNQCFFFLKGHCPGCNIVFACQELALAEVIILKLEETVTKK